MIKTKYLVGLFLIIVLVSLTVTLRGAMPKIYDQVAVPASAVQLNIVSYNPNGDSKCQTDFDVASTSWSKSDYNVESNLTIERKLLSLKATFELDRNPQFVIVSRSLYINISQLPVFRINISVTDGAIYHIRFKGLDSNGHEESVWWENSPLDNLEGTSKWVTHEIDLSVFSKQATGHFVSAITSIQLILAKPSNQVTGEKTLQISSISFSERDLKLIQLPVGTASFSSDIPFQFVIMNIPEQYVPSEPWVLQRAAVTYTLTANDSSGYQMALFSNGEPVMYGPVFLTHQSSFADSYMLLSKTYFLGDSFLEQMSSIQPLLHGCSIVILNSDWTTAGFNTFSLDSLELSSLRILVGEANNG
jgi:hypothetical protein